jgi:hypothetical protein
MQVEWPGGCGEPAVAVLGSTGGARRLRRLLVFPLLAVVAVLSLPGAVAEAGETAGSGIVSFSVDDARSPALLSGSEGFNSSPVVSPDGCSVAFISDRELWKAVFKGCDCSDAVYVMQIDGRGMRRVSAPVDAASWSPKGNMLALAVGDWVETLSADGRREHVVYHGSLGSPDALTAPGWIPDGKRIIVAVQAG